MTVALAFSGRTARRGGRTFSFLRMRWLPVYAREGGDRLGRLRDLVMVDDGDGLVAGAFVIRSAGTKSTWLLPWQDVASVDEHAVLVDQPRSARSGAPGVSPIVRIRRDILAAEPWIAIEIGSGRPAMSGLRWLRAGSGSSTSSARWPELSHLPCGVDRPRAAN
jgi:hypothetical protein